MKENRHGRISRPFARYRKRVQIPYSSAAQDRDQALTWTRHFTILQSATAQLVYEAAPCSGAEIVALVARQLDAHCAFVFAHRAPPCV